MSEVNLPIGLFDSGVGGLSVLKHLRRLLPAEDFIYLGDTARTPYGTKGPQTIIQYSEECVRYLEHQKVKLIVVACNTASSAALPTLMKSSSVPVIGMIEPASEFAISTKANVVGVIGTRATINSGEYQRTLKSLNPELKIISKACPLFVPLVEEGIFDGEIVDGIINLYLSDIRTENPDTLILACTHYPLLRSAIEQYFGLTTRIIDCGEAAAEVVKEKLKKFGLQRKHDTEGSVRYFVTDDADRFKLIGRVFLGYSDMQVSVIQNLSEWTNTSASALRPIINRPGSFA